MTTYLNCEMLAALAVVLAANLAIRPNSEVPNIEILPDMAHSAAYASFSPNPVLPGGKTFKRPVPGDVASRLTRLHYTASPEEAARQRWN